MRHWFILVLMLVMPLRGMAADWMALAMAVQQGAAAHHATAPAAAAAPVLPTSAHPDCPDHPQAGAMPAGGAGGTATASLADDHCATCASCMVCSSSAIATQVRVVPAGPVRHVLAHAGVPLFSSAEPLPGFKPPIS